MKLLSLLLLPLIFVACAPAPTPLPTYTPYPTSTPYPTPRPAGADFLEALQIRVERDDSIPLVGRESIMALIGLRPTYVFIEDPGLVLQYNVALPQRESDIKKTAVLLIGTGIIVAGEYGTPLTGIEVVFYTTDQEPWLAMALAPPWDTDDMRLAPLHPEYVKQLEKAGVITPTPGATY